MSDKQLSEAEAKKEYEDIQAELAAANEGEKPKEEEKPIPDEPEENPNPKEEKDEPEDQPEEAEKPVEVKQRRGEMVPLSKYQTVKKESEDALKGKDEVIANLTAELNKSKTQKEMGTVVKQFAEKHGVTEDFVLEMADMLKGQSALDPDTAATLKKSQAFIAKQEAEEAFQSEFQGLVADYPEAAERMQEVRTQAYKDGNLNKSLFEIYTRYVKPADPVRKKTGETTTRSGRDNAGDKFDLQKTADRVYKQEPGALKGLTDEQTDAVFDHIAKNGSRYK